MAWIDQSTEDSAGWSRTRLAHTAHAVAVTNLDEMRSVATENRLGLCIFSYGPLVINASDTQYGWAVNREYGSCIPLLAIDSSKEAIVVNGYLSPVIFLLTLITNLLVCAVLLQRHMRTPTNIFLVALAVSDALTGLMPLPVFAYFYTFGAYQSILVPLSWCHIYRPMGLHLPTTWHTASIWLTVGLAFQRYVYICYQQIAKRLCTVRNAVIAVIGVYVAAILSQLFRNFENRYEPISLSVPLGAIDADDSATERINITGCYLMPTLTQYNELYLITYW